MTKNLVKTLVTASMIALASVGCAGQQKHASTLATTNLQENLKGKIVKTQTYNTENFSVNGKTAYIVGKEPIKALLPNGKVIETDRIYKLKETKAYEDVCNSTVNFESRKNPFVFADVNVATKNGKNVFYITGEKDETEEIILPSQYNVPEYTPQKGFSIEKIKTNPVEINQTIKLAKEGDGYVFPSIPLVYTNSKLEKLADSAPVIMIPIKQTDGTREFTDYGTNQRGIEGYVKALIRVSSAPEVQKKEPNKKVITPSGIRKGKKTSTIPQTPTIQTAEPELMEYTVKKGDTPIKIALSKGMCPEQFARANQNRLKCWDMTPNQWGECDQIHPGDKLLIWKHKKIRR